MNIIDEFVDGLKRPFQTAEEQKTNNASSVASYAAVLAFIVFWRS